MNGRVSTQKGPVPAPMPDRGGVLRRRCVCGQHTTSGGECAGCRDGRGGALRRSATARSDDRRVPDVVHEALRSPGRPLDPAVRSFMEPRFGHDFSRVRVHSDGKSATSARAVDSLAYTVGDDVVFGQDQYAPATPLGQRLLAHELAHVVQQGGRPADGPLRLGSPDDAHEHDAEAVSAQVLTRPGGEGSPVETTAAEPGTLQGGWPVIVAAGAGVLGAVYALWAYTCLKPLERPMFTETFGTDAARSGGFRLWYYNQTHAPVPSNVWDAFGHCWVACAGAEKCGSFTAAVAGKTREFFREYLDSDPHDSYQQDTNNQTLGRGFGSQGQDCRASCSAAALPGGGMDLSAPKASYWDPARGDFASLSDSPAGAPDTQTAAGESGAGDQQTASSAVATSESGTSESGTTEAA